MSSDSDSGSGSGSGTVRAHGPFDNLNFTGATHVNLAYGALLYLGGAYAYQRAKSRASVMASSAFATGLVVGSLLIAQQNHVTGHGLCAGTAGTLASLMTVRTVTTKSPIVLTVGATAWALTAYNYNKYVSWADYRMGAEDEREKAYVTKQ